MIESKPLDRILFFKKYFWVIIFAGLLTACFKSVVNPVAEKCLPVETITIRRTDNIEGRNVTILYEEYAANEDELFVQIRNKNEMDNDGWNYVQGVMYESWTMLVDTPDSVPVSFETNVSPRKYLTFLVNRNGGTAEIKAGDKSLVIDCCRDQDQSDILRVYPFEKSNAIIWIRLILYLVIYALFLLIFAGSAYVIKKIRIPEIVLKPVERSDFVLCSAILFAIGTLYYKIIGIPNYLKAGDEVAYWNTTLFKDGRFSWDYLASLFKPRGYWCYIPQTVVRGLGSIVSCDPIIIWILLLSVCWSWFLIIVFPGVYECYSEKKPIKIHWMAVMIALCTVWRYMLTSVLMDGFGMITFFSFVYFLGRFAKEIKLSSAIWAGIMASVSCSFRAAHFVGIVGFLVFEILMMIRRGIRCKKYAIGILGIAAAFVIICIPQLIINMHRGNAGLLPYDDDNTYLNRSLMAWSSDYSIAHGNVAYPLLATDDQMLTLKNQHYDNDAPLTNEQVMDIYTDSPIETLMIITKKILIGFDQKTNIAFPGDGAVRWRETEGMLFSLWNYLLLFSGAFALFNDVHIRINEKLMAGLVFALLVVPETYMKIEWRYVIAGYFMIYYFFSFYFVDRLVADGKEAISVMQERNYSAKLCAFVFIYLTMSFMLLA